MGGKIAHKETVNETRTTQKAPGGTSLATKKEVIFMEETSLTIDTRGLPVPERPKKVAQELEKVKSGALAEIVADDPRLPGMAPKMIAAIGKAELIRTWQGEDGFYHALVKRT